MKGFDKIIFIFILLTVSLFSAVNFAFLMVGSDNAKLYKVEISRVEYELMQGHEVSAESFDAILGIFEYDEENFYYSENEYVIRNINGKLYRIEYDSKNEDEHIRYLILSDLLFAVLFVIMLTILLYIRFMIVKPFHEISELPQQLAKGKLTAALKENKNRYFGKFIWGLDMLREELEHSEQRELEYAKKEKTAILSLSHDIKTPLSAIKLYAKALSKGLYFDVDKQRSAYEGITLKADEIENRVNEIMEKLSGDFMDFDITLTELYLSQVMNKVKTYYSEKLSSLGTDFTVEGYVDCLLSCDPDRLEEVLQNIIENAVKYGDGHDISISCRDEEDYRLITVSNSGCTLPDTELPHIFDSFWRGSNIGNCQGNGLGLYICRRLMNNMGGDIYAEILKDRMSVTVVCRKPT